MFLDIHLSKRANIADTSDVNGKLVIEVNDVGSFMSQPKTENKWSDKRTQQLFNEKCLANITHVCITETKLSPLKCSDVR